MAFEPQTQETRTASFDVAGVAGDVYQVLIPSRQDVQILIWSYRWQATDDSAPARLEDTSGLQYVGGLRGTQAVCAHQERGRPLAVLVPGRGVHVAFLNFAEASTRLELTWTARVVPASAWPPPDPPPPPPPDPPPGVEGLDGWLASDDVIAPNIDLEYPVSSGANRGLVVYVATANTTITSVTYGGVDVPFVAGAQVGATNRRARLYLGLEDVLVAAVGSTVRVVIAGGSAPFAAVAARSVRGLNQTTPVRESGVAASVSGGSPNPIALTLTTGLPFDLVVAAGQNGLGGPPAPTLSWAAPLTEEIFFLRTGPAPMVSSAAEYSPLAAGDIDVELTYNGTLTFAAMAAMVLQP